MAKGDVVGHVACPICGFADALVKLDKNERAYIYCEDGCSWQGITRHAHQDRKLRERMRPLATPPAPAPKADPVPDPDPPPAPPKARMRTLLG